MSDRKPRSVWTWIVAVLIGGPVLYVLSFGPVCWWVRPVPRAYWPIAWLAVRSGDGVVYRTIRWYATLHADFVAVPCSFQGDEATLFMTGVMERLYNPP